MEKSLNILGKLVFIVVLLTIVGVTYFFYSKYYFNDYTSKGKWWWKRCSISRFYKYENDTIVFDQELDFPYKNVDEFIHVGNNSIFVSENKFYKISPSS